MNTRCLHCRTPVDPGDRFCRRCGAALVEEPSQDELRFVTVLFSDVSGYTELSDRYPAEDVREVMAGIYDRALQLVDTYGGTVEKFIGDAVVAFFGLDRVREDDGLRAVHMARELHGFVDTLGPGPGGGLAMHSGITSGPVVFGPGARGLRGALGMPVNVAARLSALAPPGEIYVEASLESVLTREFELDALGPQRLKGVREPVAACRVAQVRRQPRACHGEVEGSVPCIGRDAPLQLVEEKIAALANGRGSAVCIMGEAGVGKSRLLAEIRRRGNQLCWLEGRCVNHGRSTPYRPLAEITASLLHLDHVPDAGELSVRLAPPGMGHGLPSDAGRTQDPVVWKMAILEGFYDLVRNSAARQPLVVCIEDLHWADRSTLDMLRCLVAARQVAYPCLFLFSSRPEAGLLPEIESITLGELSRAETTALLTSLLKSSGRARTLGDDLYRVTGGNPFFLEEVVAHLGEGGLDADSPVPTSVRALVAARLDLLGDLPRRVLQEAAVIGERFDRGLLTGISGLGQQVEICLETLVESGFLRRCPHEEYAFRHAITRDVAYDSLLRRDRRALHRRVAAMLESGADASPPDLVAWHCLCGEDHARALPCCRKAALRCREAGSWVEAAAHVEAAAGCLERLEDVAGRPEKLREIWEELWGYTRLFAPVRAAAALEKIADSWHAEDNRGAEAVARIRLIIPLVQLGRYARAEEEVAVVAGLAGDDLTLRASLDSVVAYLYNHRGETARSLAVLDRSRPVFREGLPLYLAVNSSMTLSAYAWRGAVRDALLWYQAMVPLSRGHSDMEMLCGIWLCLTLYLKGDFAAASRVLSWIHESERRLGSLAGGLSMVRTHIEVYFKTRYLGQTQSARDDLQSFAAADTGYGSLALRDLYAGWIALEERRLDEARDCLERALPDLRQGTSNRVPFALNALAELAFLRGELPAARRLLSESLSLSAGANEEQYLCALRLQGRLLRCTGQVEAARQLLAQACRRAARSLLWPQYAWSLSELGHLWALRGEQRRSRAALQRAARLWQDMGCPYQAQKITGEG